MTTNKKQMRQQKDNTGHEQQVSKTAVCLCCGSVETAIGCFASNVTTCPPCYASLMGWAAVGSRVVA